LVGTALVFFSMKFIYRRIVLMMSPFFHNAVLALVLFGVATNAHSQVRYTYSTAGDEVTDAKTGLTWRRCSEGQAWGGGNCVGAAATYTHEQAIARATTQAGTAGWRLPNVKELTSITDKTRSNPAIDNEAFPATPPYFYWSATPGADNSGTAWYVAFGTGYGSGGQYRNVSYHVRLVR
jgi:hypothetical protein